MTRICVAVMCLLTSCIRRSSFFVCASFVFCFFFFFQAEDGIRDVAVTGVQTCALPIYGRRADEAGDAAQALEPRPAALDARAHEIVPRLAGRRRQLHRAVHRARRDPAERDPRDDRRDPLVGDDEVRAAAEDAEGEPATPRPRARVQEPGLVAHLDEVARRSEEHTSELQSRLHLVCRLLLEKKKKKTKISRLNTR